MKDSFYSTISDCNISSLPKITNRAGNITPITPFENIPFEIKRIYYLYDVPGGESRGGHAHKALHQLLIAASGSFDVFLEDGKESKLVSLNRPYYGLIIVPGIWRQLQNFSSGSICLVIGSEKYQEQDYIRSYHEFKKYKRN